MARMYVNKNNMFFFICQTAADILTSNFTAQLKIQLNLKYIKIGHSFLAIVDVFE